MDLKMPEDLYVTKSKVTGRLFSVGSHDSSSGLAAMMNHAYQTDEYFVEPFDPTLAAGFLGASGGD